MRQEAVSPERALYLPTFSHLVIVNTTPLSLSPLSRVPGANLRLGSACLPFTLILTLVVPPTPNLIGCPSQHRGNAGHGLSAVTVAKTENLGAALPGQHRMWPFGAMHSNRSPLEITLNPA